MSDVSARLRQAAFELFERDGYATTTVDAIAERAGVGRTTFFRHFGSKEEVIFPDHSEVLRRVKERLAGSDPDEALTAVAGASRLVLRRYVEEGELARSRYRLTRTVASLRAREIAHMQQYLREFREFVRHWTGEAPGEDLRAELLASAIVVAHNHVLRRWLRRESTDPEAELDSAMDLVTTLYGRGAEPGGSTVLVLGSHHHPDTVATLVRRALRE